MNKLKVLLITIIAMIPSLVNAQVVDDYELRAFIRNNGLDISIERYAYLSKGEQAYEYKTFYAGNTYAIIAYTSAYDVRDIDIYLYDDDGSLVVKDTKTDKTAVLIYRCYVTRRMRIVLENYDSRSSTTNYKCKFVVAYTDND